MKGPGNATGDVKAEGFTWHPVYAGKSFEQVRSDLVEDISRDQRAYALAMDGAEASEHDSLTAVVELERRWSDFEFDWAETDPSILADRILKFEQVREGRKEQISFSEYRASGALVDSPQEKEAAPSASLPVMKIGAVILAVLIVIFVVAVLL
jgi:hypothetical protein